MAAEPRKMITKWGATCVDCGLDIPAGALCRLTPPPAGSKGWIAQHLDACPNGVVDTGFAPTAEQEACLALYLSGASMVIEAGAGTGKTSTLRLLAKATPNKRIHYLAFNKPIVLEVAGSMPSNVKASTAHSLAHSYVCKGTEFIDRLEVSKRRMKASEVARRLQIKSFRIEDQDRTLSADKCAVLVQQAINEFCKTADEKPTHKHVPYVDGIDDPGPRGARTYKNNKALAKHLVPFITAAWRDLVRPTGQLGIFGHQHYLKIWQLSHPVIETDVILFDEAQDANPVMAAVIAEQTNVQRVYVGDSNQAIYEFTGAVNAIADMKASGVEVRYLTKSFRFGPAVADAANIILTELGSELKLEGFDKIASKVGAFDGEPDAILTRTNAAAVDCILAAQERGVSARIEGGGIEVLSFARGVRDLERKGFTEHPELACFSSWNEVLDYAGSEDGADLKLNVDLINKYGLEVIEQALGSMPREEDADLIISTAHKSKGKEWDKVVLAGDFVKQTKNGEKPAPVPASELRLRYVAVTRAKLNLDASVLFAEVEVGF